MAMVGAQEDMIVNVALDILKSRAAAQYACKARPSHRAANCSNGDGFFCCRS